MSQGITDSSRAGSIDAEIYDSIMSFLDLMIMFIVLSALNCLLD